MTCSETDQIRPSDVWSETFLNVLRSVLALKMVRDQSGVSDCKCSNYTPVPEPKHPSLGFHCTLRFVIMTVCILAHGDRLPESAGMKNVEECGNDTLYLSSSTPRGDEAGSC